MNFDTRGQRVLVFENDRAVLEMLQIRFDVAGYHIMCARNGMAAIEMLGVMRPDVVIMEMALPEADGFRILEVLRQRYGKPPFPILIMGRALGVEDSLINFEGLTPQMLEALAKDNIKTLEDFATCADWELAGGWTTENGQRKKDEGVLEKFDVSLEEAQHLVMTARVMLGWVDPTAAEDYVEEEAETEADDEDEEAGA